MKNKWIQIVSQQGTMIFLLQFLLVDLTIANHLKVNKRKTKQLNKNITFSLNKYFILSKNENKSMMYSVLVDLVPYMYSQKGNILHLFLELSFTVSAI